MTQQGVFEMVRSNRDPNMESATTRGVKRAEEYDFEVVAPESEPVEPDEEPSSEEVDIVVAHIKRLTRTASLEFALRVGAVIIHHFYDGDADAWRSRGPKTASFRRLARHPDLPLSPGALYRCVALFELCQRLNAPSRWEHLSASHLRLVLGLPGDIQEKLLATANARRWPVKLLQQEVAVVKAAHLRRGGRRAQSPLAKSLLSVTRSLDDHRSVLRNAGKTSLSQLTPSELTRSLRLVEEARASLEALSSCLRVALESARQDA
jgi:hypothetical protein